MSTTFFINLSGAFLHCWGALQVCCRHPAEAGLVSVAAVRAYRSHRLAYSNTGLFFRLGRRRLRNWHPVSNALVEPNPIHSVEIIHRPDLPKFLAAVVLDQPRSRFPAAHGVDLNFDICWRCLYRLPHDGFTFLVLVAME